MTAQYANAVRGECYELRHISETDYSIQIKCEDANGVIASAERAQDSPGLVFARNRAVAANETPRPAPEDWRTSDTSDFGPPCGMARWGWHSYSPWPERIRSLI